MRLVQLSIAEPAMTLRALEWRFVVRSSEIVARGFLLDDECDNMLFDVVLAACRTTLGA